MPSTESVWPRTKPSNIIVRMPNWLGDLVMATPVLADLRSLWPDARITAMCPKAIGPLLLHDPHVDDTLLFTKPSGWIHRHHPLPIIREIEKGNYDLGILLTHSFSSAWWFWKGGVKERLGYSGHWRSKLLTRSVTPSAETQELHQVLYYKKLLEAAGLPSNRHPPRLYVSQSERIEAKELLALYGIDLKHHKVIGINPGAAYGSAKCWLPERFRELTLKLLEDPNAYVVYFGDMAGASLVEKICRNLSTRVIDLSGKTSIRELMALIERCQAFLTNDSGPMHMASALEIPLVALFGSTSPDRTGPYNGGHVIWKQVECSPCYKRVCPIDFRCMTGISVDEVYQALQECLEPR